MEKERESSRVFSEHFKPVNPFKIFFLWACQSDRRVLEMCTRWTQMRHVSRGVFVLVTGVFAFGAAYYALTSTAGVSREIALLVALLWGGLIFMIDRDLVGDWSRKSLWIRLVLAGILGTIMAIPAELKLLEARIDQQISRLHASENSKGIENMHLRQQALDLRETGLYKQLGDVQEQIGITARNREAEVVGTLIPNQTTGRPTEGPAFRAAEARLTELHKQEDALRKDVEEINKERAAVTSDYKSEEIGSVHDFPARYEAMSAATPIMSPLWRISWLITLALIILDMTPVLMKANSPITDYDELIATQMNENKQRVRKIAEYNQALIDSDFLTPQPSTVELFEKIFSSKEVERE